MWDQQRWGSARWRDKTWGGFERKTDGGSGNPDVYGQFIKLKRSKVSDKKALESNNVVFIKDNAVILLLGSPTYYMQPFKSLRSVRFFLCFWKVSYTHKGYKNSNIVKYLYNLTSSCDATLNFQSSVSHDPSEIILIGWFAAQETFIFIMNVENSCATFFGLFDELKE